MGMLCRTPVMAEMHPLSLAFPSKEVKVVTTQLLIRISLVRFERGLAQAFVGERK